MRVRYRWLCLGLIAFGACESRLKDSETTSRQVANAGPGADIHWAFDGASTGRNSATPGQYDALAQGGPVRVTDAVSGSALSFDEFDDYLVVPELQGAAYGTTFKVSFYFKNPSRGGSAHEYLYSHGATLQPNSLNVWLVESNGYLRTGIGTKFVDVRYDYADNRWHHYELARSGSKLTISVDGDEKHNIDLGDTNAIVAPDSPLYLAARSDYRPHRYFGGLLDEVRVSLNATEMVHVGTATSVGSTGAVDDPTAIQRTEARDDELREKSGVPVKAAAGGSITVRAANLLENDTFDPNAFILVVEGISYPFDHDGMQGGIVVPSSGIGQRQFVYELTSRGVTDRATVSYTVVVDAIDDYVELSPGQSKVIAVLQNDKLLAGESFGSRAIEYVSSTSLIHAQQSLQNFNLIRVSAAPGVRVGYTRRLGYTVWTQSRVRAGAGIHVKIVDHERSCAHVPPGVS